MKKAIVVCLIAGFMLGAAHLAAIAEEETSAGVGVSFEEYGYDMWGDPGDETGESEWDGGIGRGEPDADAIVAAGGDGTGRYD
jgi:hypothetical protein